MTHRIACVQHGDYLEALKIITSGAPEPYSGMANSLDVLAKLFADQEHLVVSLNAPAYRTQKERGLVVSVPQPKLPVPFPGRLLLRWRANRILREIRAFNPTHFLLRSGGPLAFHLLKALAPLRLNTLVVCANRFEHSSPSGVPGPSDLVSQLNAPHIYRVGNHRWPATQSMIQAGVNGQKAVAYDWPAARHPRDYSVKKLASTDSGQLLFVGKLVRDKGVWDAVQAADICLRRGRAVRLVLIGDGPELAALRCHAASNPHLQVLGRRANDEVFQAMLESDLVIVPSRHEFSEGMPFTLTEALTSRTPVIASDHPVFLPAFQNGEGIVFFRAGDDKALADAIIATLSDADAYERMSKSTLAAFERVECAFSFEDLVSQWRSSF